MKLYSLVRPKNPSYQRGKLHKVFENKLQQGFHADRVNHKWCTDFTYLFLKNEEVRYNCSIIDLYDRSVIASVTDRPCHPDFEESPGITAADQGRIDPPQ